MVLASLVVLSVVRLARPFGGWRGRVAAALLAVLVVSQTSFGQSPPYLVLHRPPALHHGAGRHQTPQPMPPRAIPVPRAGYAYGWFGAQPGRRMSLHHGYRNNYTLWMTE